MPLLHAAFVIGPDPGTLLGGVPVVAHEDDDGVPAQLALFKTVENPAHAVVGGGDHAGVGLPRHGQVLVALLELPVGLFGVVGDVEGHVEEEGLVPMGVDVVEGAIRHQVREVLVALEDLHVVLVEVVEALPVQEEVVVVVDETAEVAEVVVESLGQRIVAFLGTEMPFTENGGGIACLPENFRDGEFGSGHVPVAAVAALAVPLGPVDHTRALGVAAGHEEGAGRATDRVGVSLGEADPGSRQAVHGGSVEILRTVTVGVQGALVVGEEEDHVGPGGQGQAAECEEASENGKGKFHRQREGKQAGGPASILQKHRGLRFCGAPGA